MSYCVRLEGKDAQMTADTLMDDLNGERPPDDEAYRPPSQLMSGAYADIGLACAVISLPMVLLSAISLGLVFHYRVGQTSLLFPDLQL